MKKTMIFFAVNVFSYNNKKRIITPFGCLVKIENFGLKSADNHEFTKSLFSCHYIIIAGM